MINQYYQPNPIKYRVDVLIPFHPLLSFPVLYTFAINKMSTTPNSNGEIVKNWMQE